MQGWYLATKKFIVGLKYISRFFFGNAKVVSPIEYGVVTGVLSTAMVTGMLAVSHAYIDANVTVAEAPPIAVVEFVE